MIMRTFRISAKDGKEEAFGDFFHNTDIPMMRGTDGIVQVLSDAPRLGSPNEFNLEMIWKDLASLKAFVGDDCQTPHIDPAKADLVAARTIKHFKLVEYRT